MINPRIVMISIRTLRPKPRSLPLRFVVNHLISSTKPKLPKDNIVKIRILRDVSSTSGIHQAVIALMVTRTRMRRTPPPEGVASSAFISWSWIGVVWWSSVFSDSSFFSNFFFRKKRRSIKGTIKKAVTPKDTKTKPRSSCIA